MTNPKPQRPNGRYPVNLNLRLGLDHHQRLNEIAVANDCTVSEAARMVLEYGLHVTSSPQLLRRAIREGWTIEFGPEADRAASNES